MQRSLCHEKDNGDSFNSLTLNALTTTLRALMPEGHEWTGLSAVNLLEIFNECLIRDDILPTALHSIIDHLDALKLPKSLINEFLDKDLLLQRIQEVFCTTEEPFQCVNMLKALPNLGFSDIPGTTLLTDEMRARIESDLSVPKMNFRNCVNLVNALVLIGAHEEVILGTKIAEAVNEFALKTPTPSGTASEYEGQRKNMGTLLVAHEYCKLVPFKSILDTEALARLKPHKDKPTISGLQRQCCRALEADHPDYDFELEGALMKNKIPGREYDYGSADIVMRDKAGNLVAMIEVDGAAIHQKYGEDDSHTEFRNKMMRQIAAKFKCEFIVIREADTTQPKWDVDVWQAERNHQVDMAIKAEAQARDLEEKLAAEARAQEEKKAFDAAVKRAKEIARQLEKEKAEAERIAAIKAQAEGIVAARIEANRVAAAKAEAERVAASKAESERAQAAEHTTTEPKVRSRKERIKQLEAQRQRMAAEKAAAEAERMAAQNKIEAVSEAPSKDKATTTITSQTTQLSETENARLRAQRFGMPPPPPLPPKTFLGAAAPVAAASATTEKTLAQKIEERKARFGKIDHSKQLRKTLTGEERGDEDVVVKAKQGQGKGKKKHKKHPRQKAPKATLGTEGEKAPKRTRKMPLVVKRKESQDKKPTTAPSKPTSGKKQLKIKNDLCSRKRTEKKIKIKILKGPQPKALIELNHPGHSQIKQHLI